MLRDSCFQNVTEMAFNYLDGRLYIQCMGYNPVPVYPVNVNFRRGLEPCHSSVVCGHAAALS